MARILIFEDVEPYRRGLTKYLRGLGHDVEEAGDGKALAKLLAEGSPPDLVITDLNMPDMDGLEVIKSLRERSVDVPIIAMSGGGLFAKEFLLRHADALGATVTLAKPFELETLRDLVNEFLTR